MAKAADWERQFLAERDLKNAAVRRRNHDVLQLQERVAYLERRNRELRGALGCDKQHKQLNPNNPKREGGRRSKWKKVSLAATSSCS